MPKKTRKMKQRAAMRRAYQPIEEQAPVAEPAEPAPEQMSVRMRPTATVSRPATAAGGRGLTPLTFNYSHIYGDLKRIALFAGFFFVVLIALSFVLR